MALEPFGVFDVVELVSDVVPGVARGTVGTIVDPPADGRYTVDGGAHVFVAAATDLRLLHRYD